MLKLKSKKFESSVVSHPVQSGTNRVVYTITHGLGQVPDLARVFAKFSSYTNWTEVHDFEADTANYTGYLTADTSSDKNSTDVNVYRITGSGPIDIKIIFYSLP